MITLDHAGQAVNLRDSQIGSRNGMIHQEINLGKLFGFPKCSVSPEIVG
jgi:hypothetical protein